MKHVLFPDTLTLLVRPLILHSLVTCHPADQHSALRREWWSSQLVSSQIYIACFCSWNFVTKCTDLLVL